MMQQSKARFGTEGDGWFSHDGRLWLDALPCMSSLFRYICSAHNLSGYNYLAFLSAVLMPFRGCPLTYTSR